MNDKIETKLFNSSWLPLQPLITKPIEYEKFKSIHADGADITICLIGSKTIPIVERIIQLANTMLPGFGLDIKGLINDKDELDRSACYKLLVSIYGTYMAEHATKYLKQYFNISGTISHDLLD